MGDQQRQLERIQWLSSPMSKMQKCQVEKSKMNKTIPDHIYYGNTYEEFEKNMMEDDENDM
jgi:hypothetical protein